MLFAIAVCSTLLVCVVLLIVYFLIKVYRRAEFWAPRQQTPVRGSAQEETCRVLIGDEDDVGPSEAQSIPHNNRTPREHDERQSRNISFFFLIFLYLFSLDCLFAGYGGLLYRHHAGFSNNYSNKFRTVVLIEDTFKK